MAPELYWLPAIEDWKARITALERCEAADDDAWDEMVSLSRSRLDFLAEGRLDRSLLRLFGGAPPPGLATRPVRLAVLASSTATHLMPSIHVAGLRRGLWVTTFQPDYGQYRQALADPMSGLHAFDPTTVLLALDAEHLLGVADPALDRAGADAVFAEVLDSHKAIWSAIRERFRCQILHQTVLPTYPTLLGLNEQRLPGSPAALAFRLNAALRDIAAEAGVDLLTLDASAAQDGIAAWHNPVLWRRAKQEIGLLAAPMYGDFVARLLAAGQGATSKCLVLDLDNTLWGGVIGDDGLEGIVIGQGSALGEAFAGFQAYAAGLARRGVILAVCSKNDEANALAPFEQHPDMVLKRGDISAFLANWTDKATNLREIARTLNIGLDALVFVDDNPFERDLVRRELPMVAVPELPDDPTLYARCISDAGYFESTGITAEDLARTSQYHANQNREELRASVTDIDAYLRSLGMTLSWRRFDRTGLPRVTQLINKTNQFNLTTRRYTEEEVAAITADPRAMGLQLRLVDRFGDNGVIAVVIGRMPDDRRLVIDSWLMSCRVLGRHVEAATLSVVVDRAAELGADEIVGEYRPTAKNAMVADHYLKLGFRLLQGEPDGGPTARYSLRISDYEAPVLPMAVRHE